MASPTLDARRLTASGGSPQCQSTHGQGLMAPFGHAVGLVARGPVPAPDLGALVPA